MPQIVRQTRSLNDIRIQTTERGRLFLTAFLTKQTLRNATPDLGNFEDVRQSVVKLIAFSRLNNLRDFR